MTTTLVTGGSGFVAGGCIVELLRRGHAVRTSLRNGAKEPALRPLVGDTDRLDIVTADLTDDAGWDAAMAGCDHVLHVALTTREGLSKSSSDHIDG
jgi:dihydroflavonol-4-reductase